MPKTYCIEVRGDFACFTRPEMKVERVSYDVITPSAARAIFESILWKPAIRWIPTKIEVLNPVRWISIRRNEVGSKASVANIKTAMKHGSGTLAIFVEEDRQQRAGLFLRDVRYRLHARFEMTGSSQRENQSHLSDIVQDQEEAADATRANTPEKFLFMFERRAAKGQCINQPYLGCREFACHFRLITDPSGEPEPLNQDKDLGWMLYDMDFQNPEDPMPSFFYARMKNGVIEIPDQNSDEVRR
ncbi:MAG: type I-C CRISPR-associated protein Cas5c [Leptospirales bacterium]